MKRRNPLPMECKILRHGGEKREAGWWEKIKGSDPRESFVGCAM